MFYDTSLEKLSSYYEAWDVLEGVLRDSGSDLASALNSGEICLYGTTTDTDECKRIGEDLADQFIELDEEEEEKGNIPAPSMAAFQIGLSADVVYSIGSHLESIDVAAAIVNGKFLEGYFRLVKVSINLGKAKNLKLGPADSIKRYFESVGGKTAKLASRLWKSALDESQRSLLQDDPDPRTDKEWYNPFGTKGTELESVKHGSDDDEVKIHKSPKHLPPRYDLRKHKKESSLTIDQKKQVKAEFLSDPAIIEEAKDKGVSAEDIWDDYKDQVLDTYYHARN